MPISQHRQWGSYSYSPFMEIPVLIFCLTSFVFQCIPLQFYPESVWKIGGSHNQENSSVI